MFRRILIANRAEIAIRIIRAASDLGAVAVAVYCYDDEHCLHRYRADEAVPLPGRGAAAYLDIDAIIDAAVRHECDAIHPGYGFLSENASFARRCREAGISFIGPQADLIELFGDKVKAKAFAVQCGVPVPMGTEGPAELDTVQSLFDQLNRQGRSMILKARAGGGGRGIRIVDDASQLADAFARCASEAASSFGDAALYAEEFIPIARHIEVQIIGDGKNVVQAFDRECSVQRRHQKLIEIAPSPWLPEDLRERLVHDAVEIGKAARYSGLGTVEFLVEIERSGKSTGRYFFIEMNPRLQVEHTVTEEVTGVDLVHAQIRIAAGESIGDLDLTNKLTIKPEGFAIQLRVNMEELLDQGSFAPTSGHLHVYEPPAGPGIRVDGFGAAGYRTSTSFDALLAKVIVHARSADFADAVQRALRALGEFRIEGVKTNIPFLESLLLNPAFAAGLMDTSYLEQHSDQLACTAQQVGQGRRYPEWDVPTIALTADEPSIAPGELLVRSPTGGRLVLLDVSPGDSVAVKQRMAVVEIMKMETPILAEECGTVTRLLKSAGDPIEPGQPLLIMSCGEGEASEFSEESNEHRGENDPGLLALIERRISLEDVSRPKTVALAERRGVRTARQRIAQFCDDVSFVEYGALARDEDSGDAAPADGVIMGTARVDGRPVVILSQDFSVFGGSVGHLGAAKIGRAVELALRQGVPLIFMFDGGGHRIQDGQNSREYAAAGDIFQRLSQLSGYAPIVSIAYGPGFAANTNMAGFSDFVVMVRGKASLGIAGPALVEAGTGERIDVQSLGGADMQVGKHGLASMAVDSEADADAAVRRFLSYLPSNASLSPPERGVDSLSDSPEHALPLLIAVPPNTRQSYDVRPVIAHVADCNSMFEIKADFAENLVTAFAMVRGRPVGFIANQPQTMGGMLDAAACEKGAHFIAICDAFGLPLIYLVDIPGFSIGSSAEATNLGRKSARMLFEIGHATVPRISVVLRKGYGLGYYAMAGGRSFAADAAFAWPNAEICAMSIEGSVDVAYRRDYEAAEDPAARRALLVDEIRSRISPLQAAEGFGIDDLIDPRETRSRICDTLDRAPKRRNLSMPAKFRSIAPI